jgi:hypothetical protein
MLLTKRRNIMLRNYNYSPKLYKPDKSAADLFAGNGSESSLSPNVKQVNEKVNENKDRWDSDSLRMLYGS